MKTDSLCARALSVLLLWILLAPMLVFSGCGGKDAKKEPQKSPAVSAGPAKKEVAKQKVPKQLGAAFPSGGPEYVPVEGTLKIDGQVVSDIGIDFVPLAEGISIASGKVENGKFRLFAGAQGKPGAEVGKYKVVLRDLKLGSGDSSKPEAAELPFPEKFAGFETSDKEIEVKAGGSPYDIVIASGGSADSGWGYWRSGGPKTVPVEGTLTIEGQVVSDILIHFVPVEAGMSTASGIVENGKFKLFAGAQGKPGAEVGKYKVVLCDLKAGSDPSIYAKGGSGDSSKPEAAKLPFPEKYASFETSDKEIEVKAGGGLCDIVITSGGLEDSTSDGSTTRPDA